MRVCKPILFAITVAGVLWLVAQPIARAADPGIAAETTILDQIREALGGIALLVITVIGAFLARHLPGLLEAARLWLIERATSERVQRLDDALDVGLTAGLSPEGAADMVARKLPQTLKRSNKSASDLTGEAIARRIARPTRAVDHSVPK